MYKDIKVQLLIMPTRSANIITLKPGVKNKYQMFKAEHQFLLDSPTSVRWWCMCKARV